MNQLLYKYDITRPTLLDFHVKQAVLKQMIDEVIEQTTGRKIPVELDLENEECLAIISTDWPLLEEEEYNLLKEHFDDPENSLDFTHEVLKAIFGDGYCNAYYFTNEEKINVYSVTVKSPGLIELGLTQQILEWLEEKDKTATPAEIQEMLKGVGHWFSESAPDSIDTAYDIVKEDKE